MTGFGKSFFENENYKIDIEVRSLNSKSLDLSVKCNFPLGQNEIEIQNKISQLLIRGKIDVFIKIQNKIRPITNNINKDVFAFYYNQIAELSWKLNKNIDNEQVLGAILKLPNVLETSDFDVSVLKDLILNTLEQAISKVLEFRNNEGNVLEKDLIENLKDIEKRALEIEKYEQQRIETTKNRIKSAFENAQISVDSQRFESELIFYLEKFDINEEKKRLASHFDYFRKTINEQQPGKKLGFIVQEINREINTIGSKANHFDIQRLVVEMKDYNEKIKEQVQNIL